MRRRLFSRRAAVLALTLVPACGGSEARPESGPTSAEQVDLAAIQRVVDLTYEVSSFDDVGSADPEAFRAPFTPTATLGYTRDGALVTRTVDDYVEIRRGMVEAGEPRSLVEWEVTGSTELFGDVAHRISSYAVRVDGADSLAERGVMSFQLVRVSGEWKVHSLLWHAESEDRPIPARYLADGGP